MACADTPTLTILLDRLVNALLSMTSPQTAMFAMQSALVLWLALTVGSSVVAALILVPRARRRSERRVDEWPNIGVIIPCYMPNEWEIIRGTIDAVGNSAYPGEMCIHVPFNGNTPDVDFELPSEANGRTVFGYSVDGSRSKAANATQALSSLPEGVSIVVIFDADHHPTHDTVEQLVRVLINSPPECVCAQGAVLPVRGDASLTTCWLKWLVSGMEYTGWRFYIPGVALLNGSAWFAGANAAWRRKDLEDLELSTDAVTEDIEVSIRAMLTGRHMCLAPWAVVEELCPPSFMIFVRQRLRWALGWEQATFKHFCSVLKTRKRALVLLFSRYINVAAGLFAVINLITRLLDFVNAQKSPAGLPVMLLTSTAGYTGVVALLCATLAAITDGESIYRLLQIVTFMSMAPVFVVWQIYTFVRSWATLMCCAVVWIPTTRTKNAVVHRIQMDKVTQKMPGRAVRVRLGTKHSRLATVEEGTWENAPKNCLIWPAWHRGDSGHALDQGGSCE